MRLKQIIGFVLVLLSSFPVVSGTMGDIEPLPVECNTDNNCNRPIWEFSAKALYLSVAYGHDPWISEKTLIDTLTGYTQNPVILKGYGWGGFLEGMYHFQSDKALDLNIYYFDDTDKRNGLLPNGGLRTVVQRSKWVSGNFELHQVLPIADNNAIRVYMGVNYTYLNKKRDFYREIRNLALNNLNTVTGESTGGYYGAGPRWGGHVDYYLPSFLMNGFRIYGDGAAGILLGRSRSGVIAITDPVVPALGIVNRRVHQFSVVFEFDARLGFGYIYHLPGQGQVALDAGWMVYDYLSAIEDKVNAESTDVLYEGFYFGVKWLGDFA